MGCGARVRGAAELAPTCVFRGRSMGMLARYILHTHEVSALITFVVPRLM